MATSREPPPAQASQKSLVREMSHVPVASGATRTTGAVTIPVTAVVATAHGTAEPRRSQQNSSCASRPVVTADGVPSSAAERRSAAADSVDPADRAVINYAILSGADDRTVKRSLLLPVAVGTFFSVGMPDAQTVTVESVLAKATPYVAIFLERFSNVVTEERYSQAVRRPTAAGSLQFSDRRELRSDVIIIKDDTPSGWTMLRDVFEVNGKPVRDREERLTKLFEQQGADGRMQAKRIAEESARYNIGPGIRTTNTPELSLSFLQASLRPRFTFTLGARERSMGDAVWILNYREQARPTIVRGEEDNDLPAQGRFWIDADTGRVLQTEIVLRPTAGRGTQTTIYKAEGRLGIAVPVEMKEYLVIWATEMNATATYSRFRTFGVAIEEQLR